MTNIYFLSQSLDAGGVEKAICLQANTFQKHNFNVIIINLFDSKPIIELNENIIIKVISPFHSDRLNKHSLLYRLIRKIISKILLINNIRKINNGIIISTRNEYSTLLSKYGKKNTLKIAELHHDHLFNKRLLHDFVFKYTHIDYFIHLTDMSCNEISEIMKKKNQYTKNVTIPNFVSEYEHIECIRKNYCISVGRFSPEKGFDRLIDIWSMVAEKEKDWKLILIGDGPCRKEYETKIKMLGLEERIILTGFLINSDTMKLMSESKIYLMTSYTEAFPFTLIEGMQNCLPTIAFDVRTGPHSLIKNGENGFLIPDNQNELFANKVISLIQNPELLSELGEKAYEKSKLYLEETVFIKWKKLFSNVYSE